MFMSKRDTKSQLRVLHALSAASYIVLAAVAGFFMAATAYQLTIGHWAKNELASRTTTVFAPAQHPIFDLELRWLLVTFLVFSAILPILYLTRWQARYTQTLKSKVNKWRWVDLAVSAALMLEVIAILSGATDIMTLKLIGGLVITTCALGWLAERQNVVTTKKAEWSAFAISLLTGLLPWLLIFTYAAATPYYTAIRAPWYVYALYASTLIGFTLIAVNQIIGFKKNSKLKKYANDYEAVERNFVAISLLTKVAFAGILIVGLWK